MEEYVDVTGKLYHNIYLVDESIESTNDLGWYFFDGTEGLHGPFATLAETEKLLFDYCSQL